MNDDARDDTTNEPVSIKNEATPDAAIFPATLLAQRPALAPLLAPETVPLWGGGRVFIAIGQQQ